MRIINFMEYKKDVYDKGKDTTKDMKPKEYIKELKGKSIKDPEYGRILDEYTINLMESDKNDTDLFEKYNNIIKPHLKELAKEGKCGETEKIVNRFLGRWDSDNEKEATIYGDRSKIFLVNEKYDKAYSNAKKAYDIYHEQFGECDYRTIGARINLIACRKELDYYEETEDELAVILEDCFEFFDGRDPNIPNIINKMASAYGFRMKEDERVASLREMRYIKAWRIHGKEDIKTLEALYDMADSYYYSDPDKCLVIAKDAYKGCVRHLGEDHSLTLSAQRQLASAYGNNYEHEKALNMKVEIYEKAKVIYGEEARETLSIYKSLINTAVDIANLDRELEEERKIYEFQKEEFGNEETIHLKDSLNKIKVSANNLEAKELAKKIIYDAYSVVESFKSKDKKIYLWKARIYGSLEEPEMAAKNIERCYELTVEEYGEKDWESIIILAELGSRQQEAKMYQEARDSFKGAWRGSYEAFGEGSSITKMMYESYLLSGVFDE